MGCGASASQRYQADEGTAAIKTESKDTGAKQDEKTVSAAEPPASAPPPAMVASVSMTSSVQSQGTMKRRPSLGGTEESQRRHEGHRLPREGSGLYDKPGVPKPVAVQTQVELKLMEAVPAMYGVKDSMELSEELREDAQESIAQRCIAKPSGVRDILTEWLHACPDGPAREQLITFVEEQVKELPRGKVSFNQEAVGSDLDPVAKRIRNRKGTSFEAKVMPPDVDDEDEEEEMSPEAAPAAAADAAEVAN